MFHTKFWYYFMNGYLKAIVKSKCLKVAIGSFCILAILPVAAYVDDIYSSSDNPDYCVKRNLILRKIRLLPLFDEKYISSIETVYNCALRKKNIVMVSPDSLLDNYDHTEDSEYRWKYELVKALYLPNISNKCSAPEKAKDCIVARFDITRDKPAANSIKKVDFVHYVLLVKDEGGKYKKVDEGYLDFH
jgi:hypothetical protein